MESRTFHGRVGAGITVALDLTPANLVGYPSTAEALRADDERLRSYNYFNMA